MMGKDVRKSRRCSTTHTATVRAGQRVLVEAKALGRSGSVEPFDLQINTGEVLGLAGLLGSGRTEMIRLFFGIDRPDSGELKVDNQHVSIRSPRQAIDLGMGFCPEERKFAGIVPDLSVRENIILVLQAQRGWLMKLSRSKQEKLADHYIRALNIATSDAEKEIKFLSGGNQQKAILARWLASKPRLLILDEPTRGIDVGGEFEIARLMEELRLDGVAIIFVSAELEEVVRDRASAWWSCDRHKIAELSGEQISEHNIMSTIAGHPAGATHDAAGDAV